ncbi:MAG: ATP-binding cassette domain-containing protein [Candidatus Hydrogenedentes bacterium]|nr:ATP-binding cassette domain-containing protein [Candidatus Hydrogenedentota bacterium]
MISAEGLRKVFYASRGLEVVAVKGATFSVDAGEVFGLLGPNGAGKTTLLRMLGTIITPTSGICRINGQITENAPDSIRKEIGFLSGNTKLYGRLTARELLRYFGRLYDMADPAIAIRTAELAELLQMHDFLDRRCEALSTGQTQKVSIARVILHDPKVLILDEPTLGLDIMTSRSILDFILLAKGRGHSIIFSTHHMSEADYLCDRVGLIYEGELMAVDEKAALLAGRGVNNLHDAFLSLVDERERQAS